MKNIADSGILDRIRKLAPQSAERAAPFRTPEEWREWQLAEGRRSCEEIDRQNRQARAEKSSVGPGFNGCIADARLQITGYRTTASAMHSVRLNPLLVNWILAARTSCSAGIPVPEKIIWPLPLAIV